MGVVVMWYIDILTIINNFPYSTCISSFLGSSIPNNYTSLLIFKMFFRSLIIIVTLDLIKIRAQVIIIIIYICDSNRVRTEDFARKPNLDNRG